jgi:hypothetical protein
MKRTLVILFGSFLLLVLAGVSTAAQDKEKKDSKFKEVYTGTIVTMNGPMRSTTFNLSIRDYTSDEDTQRYLGILAEGDQDDLLKVIRDLELGRLSTQRTVGRNLIVVRKTQLSDGHFRIVAVFERWQTFAEIRGGYRTQDYPFGLMEIMLDADGKKGSGTFIAACKIDLKRDKKTGKYQLELENFGTYPNKVMGVLRR